jgi:hypothetical protein
LFFGGSDGLSAFYPNKLADNPTPPPVVLTEFELFNEPVEVGGRGSPLQQAIHVASRITLRHDQSVFRFQFAALNYDSPQKNKYAYKMEGCCLSHAVTIRDAVLIGLDRQRIV